MAADGGEAGVMAYVASQRVTAPGQDVVLELRATAEGQTAVLAFTSLDMLVEGCGTQQPWVAVPVEQLDELVQRAEANGVLWDAELSDEQRHGPFGDGVISEGSDPDA